MTEEQQPLPLAGIKVVEFSTMITASLATMMFAQQGAEVIKVEPPGIGDPMRWLGSQKAGISGLFNNCNRSKRSIVLDLKNDKDVAAAKALCLDADIVIHNYRPGVMTRLGLGSKTLRAEKPTLIYCAVTGFGRAGPMADRPAYDHVMQAMSGIMDVQGDNGTTDKKGGFAYVKTLMCDKITAYTAAQAITAALFARERTGNGAHLDLSMLASCIAFLWPDGGMHLTLLDDDVIHGVPFSDYYQAPLPATDGAVAYAAMSDDHWAAIFDVVGRPDLKAVEKYQGLANRSVHIAELAQIVTAETPKYNSAELLKQLRKADVPAAPCLTIDALQSEDQMIAIEAFEMQDHPILGSVQNVAAPVFFNGQQLPASGPSPTLGQHSAEILDALNMG